MEVKLYSYNTKIGIINIEEDNGFISRIFFGIVKNALKETSLIKNAYTQIFEYLDGKRKNFELPLKISGTTFQKSVWEILRQIQYGETKNYKEIAKMVGKENASRAIGMACNRNPICIVIPCHRIIGADGKLTGYAGGLDVKKELLQIEKRFGNK